MPRPLRPPGPRGRVARPSWDGESTASRVELQVGRDLQFIRINGTVVGALVLFGYLVYSGTIGLTVTEIIDQAYAGNIKGMYIRGENPAMSDPDVEHARKALAHLDHMVVQDIFLNETCRYADVVLPTTCFAEKDGVFTNSDRRVQLVRKAVERMNKVGMLIDCSHCGDRTTLDTIESSELPIVLSHIGAQALWSSNRLAPDEVLGQTEQSFFEIADLSRTGVLSWPDLIKSSVTEIERIFSTRKGLTGLPTR